MMEKSRIIKILSIAVISIILIILALFIIRQSADAKTQEYRMEIAEQNDVVDLIAQLNQINEKVIVDSPIEVQKTERILFRYAIKNIGSEELGEYTVEIIEQESGLNQGGEQGFLFVKNPYFGQMANETDIYPILYKPSESASTADYVLNIVKDGSIYASANFTITVI